MKIGVLHVNSSTAASTSPTMRIAKFVSEQLHCPLIHDPDSANEYLHTKFDVLFVKYGMLKFSEHREQALQIYNNAKRVINMENDYTFVPDKRFRPADETWSTVEGKTRYINWNILTRLPLDAWKEKPKWVKPAYDALLYYGAYREGRVDDFVRYFAGRKPYGIAVSSFRGGAKFRALGPNVVSVSPFRSGRKPLEWPLALYLEDTASHELYCSLANRFYECLQIGLAQAIDHRCVKTFEKAKMPLHEAFIVCNADDVLRMIRDWQHVRHHQMEMWWADYGQSLKAQFERAVREL